MSRAVGLTVEGLLSSLEKCFLHHSIMFSLCFSKVIPPEESKGMV